MLSVVNLLRINEICLSEIRDGRIFLSLLAKTFAIILYMTLERAIGLRFDTLYGFVFSGISTMAVSFIPCKREQLLRQFRQVDVTRSHTISQNVKRRNPDS